MASLIPWLYYSGVKGSDGLPISSGTISFYTPGSTSTTVIVYGDAAETQPLTQPVPLDAAGRALVYLSKQAEVVVKDIAGVTQRLATNAFSVTTDQIPATWDGSPTTLTNILSVLNTFVDTFASAAPSLAANYVTIATASPVFMFDPTKARQFFFASYAGAMGALTVSWPSPSPSIAVNTPFWVSIQVGSGSSASSTVFDSHIRVKSPPTTWTSLQMMSALFISPPASSAGIDQITPWI